jgi:1-deoxy-D-xylulose-5-phosphate synthase
VGPIDGHDIPKLLDILQALKNNPKPTLLHVLTTKGKGMETAINNPTCYHGCKPFDKSTGHFHPTNSKPTFPQIFGRHLLKMAKQDPSIVTITPAMTAGSCLDELFKEFPKRCIDVGIAEGHAVTYAGAVGKNKDLKVVCSIYATFLQRALDNLFHDVCLQQSPVVFGIDRGGISGPDGSTHHGVYDISFLQSMPGMVICQPRNGHVLKELLESSFSWKRPVAIRYPNMATEEDSSSLKPRPLGIGEVLLEGEEIAIFSLGHMNQVAFQTRILLEKEGIFPTLIDPIFVKPLDEELIRKIVASHKYIVTIEEHSLQGGLGSSINQWLIKEGIQDIQVLNLGIPDIFLDHGSYAQIIQEAGLSAPQISKAIVQRFSLKDHLAGV